MNAPPLRAAARFGLLFTFALSATLACNADPGVALDRCGPSERHNVGGCQLCPSITTLASLTSNEVSGIFNFFAIQNARYTVLNNVGTFSTAGTNPNLPIRAPPPAPVSLQPVNGSIDVIVSISYTAFPHIRDLSLTWGPWTGGGSGVTVNAQLSGHIDVHISASPIVVNPTLTLTNLPVTITFGTDRSGNAAVTPSQIIVAPVGPHGSVDGCGAFGWCNGLVRGPIESAVQGQLQSSLAEQFTSALNGSGPFWFGLMRAVANGPLPLLRDPAGFLLPTINQATPGGTTTVWRVFSNFSYAEGKVTTTFNSSDGLCYIDCKPRLSQAQLCGPNSCGEADDGCGDTITCPGTCTGANEICTNNQCKVCIPLTCTNVAGFGCGPVSNGCGGFLQCLTCTGGTTCQDNVCVGFGGQNGTFCKKCRADGGRCTPGQGGTFSCAFQ